MDQAKMKLRYNEQPPREESFEELATEEGGIWERWSLPLGNGYFGASYYGYTDEDRIQITENSLCNPYSIPTTIPHTRTNGNFGLSSFAEIYIDFGHRDAAEYERYLDIDRAIAGIRYTADGTVFERELFTSYPDRIMAMKIKANKPGKISFFARAVIPYLRDYAVDPGDGFGKRGGVSVNDSTITLSGYMDYYGIAFEGQIKVFADGGKLSREEDGIRVEGADEATLLFSCGTNYKLESRVFLESDPKKKLSPYEHPHAAVTKRINDAEKKGYDKLLKSHLQDYCELYGRTRLTAGEEEPEAPTNVLVGEYRSGKHSRYLELLLFQYGRYLLISSSRQGALPANLQGVWNRYVSAPWSAGYWHNINVQMNYWPACTANLAETFLPYADYNQAYMPSAKQNADRCIKNNYSASYTEDGTNGWIIGTGAWPYVIEGFEKINHSGPGTGAFTSLLFWDYYDYTRDKDFLRSVAYPVLRDMSVFLSKTLTECEGKLLTYPSASPEITHEGKYFVTRGCAFDQQMIYENHKRTVEAAKILGITDPTIEKFKAELPLLDPVIIGDSGQVKEFREEGKYADFGEYKHRHVSQLVGMFPGTLINADTKEWIEAAKVTLTERGLGSSGWSRAHRVLLWARAGRADMASTILRSIIKVNIMQNLWDQHPPFQIDGNFGYTAGICEMLLQSHSSSIDLIPALAEGWDNGSFEGLVARGNFVIGCEWQNRAVTKISAKSRAGGRLSIRERGIAGATTTVNGAPYTEGGIDPDILTLTTSPGDLVEITF